jgi:Ca2+/Na+ antiporter
MPLLVVLIIALIIGIIGSIITYHYFENSGYDFKTSAVFSLLVFFLILYLVLFPIYENNIQLWVANVLKGAVP